ALRRHFEVDAEHIAITVLSEWARLGRIGAEVVRDAIVGFGIDPDGPTPRLA
ncbi:MAG: hypothetical protein RL531_371, partial [Actinomycetota bacterium]